MDLLAIITVGILTGQAAAAFSSYSLGAVGNSIAGLTGALFLSKYMVLLFGLSKDLSLVAGGLAGALVILAVFDAGESFTRKKRKLF